MKDASWSVALIYSLAGFLIISGISALAIAFWKNYQRTQRRNRRLYGAGNRYSLRDFK